MGRKRGKAERFYVACNDTGNGRLPGVMGNDERRWDIEENGFHQLKTYYHAKHCYCHDAVETISNLIIIGFNVRELYLYRRSRSFVGSGISRKSINRIFCDELLTEKVKQILYGKGG